MGLVYLGIYELYLHGWEFYMFYILVLPNLFRVQCNSVYRIMRLGYNIASSGK